MSVEIINSFLFITSIAYFVAGISGDRWNKKMGVLAQRAYYFIIGSIILLFTFYPFNYLALLLGLVYSIIGTLCYNWKHSYQDWGTVNHNLFMTVWDYSLALIFFYMFQIL